MKEGTGTFSIKTRENTDGDILLESILISLLTLPGVNDVKVDMEWDEPDESEGS